MFSNIQMIQTGLFPILNHLIIRTETLIYGRSDLYIPYLLMRTRGKTVILHTEQNDIKSMIHNMRKRLLAGLLLTVLTLTAQAQTAADWNPQADPQAMVTSGKVRFTVLTPRMIRIQYSATQQFEDRATFAVVNRRLPVPAYTTREEGGYLYIETEALTLRYKVGSAIAASLKSPNNLCVTFQLNGREVIWYPGKDDALNLKGTKRTLDTASGDNQRPDLEDGIVSRAGWAIIDESPKTKRGDGSQTFAFEGKVDGIDWLAKPKDMNAIDWYFMGYGHDYKGAIGDYVKVAGRQPMPPLYVLGYWYSKYQRYSQQDFLDLATEIRNNGIPLDVMIFDMDWHLDGWTGWTWNKSLIPNPEGLIRWMHGQGIKVSLNLHPADGVGSHEDHFSEIRSDMGLTGDRVPWMLEDSTFYRSMFNHIIREREQQGVDFWWIDWQQNLTSNYTEGLSETFWCNHVFFNDMLLNRKDRRPFIFHRWGGLGSHRYPIGFSGDTYSTFGSLAFQPYFTATAANVCFGYWGHDLGGHMQIADTNPELMLRWLQFGVFSPIFRTHGANQAGNERRIWKYSNFSDMLECVKLRYELMPYIYTAVRQAYDTGVSICRPLYYEWPEENESYRREGEYMFGDDILVSPVVTESEGDGLTWHQTWLPEGRWYDVCRNRMMEGRQTLSDEYEAREIPYFIKAGSIVVCNPPMQNLKTAPAKLVLKLVPGADGETQLYEDAGDTQDYQNGAYCTTVISQQRTSSGVLLTIAPREGSYEGMPMERAYEVVVLLAERPSTVTLNGEACQDWTYDDDTKTLTLNIPTSSCDSRLEVSIDNASTGIASTGSVEMVAERYYDLMGREHPRKPHGSYIVRRTWSNGSVSTEKHVE